MIFRKLQNTGRLAVLVLVIAACANGQVPVTNLHPVKIIRPEGLPSGYSVSAATSTSTGVFFVLAAPGSPTKIVPVSWDGRKAPETSLAMKASGFAVTDSGALVATGISAFQSRFWASDPKIEASLTVSQSGMFVGLQALGDEVWGLGGDQVVRLSDALSIKLPFQVVDRHSLGAVRKTLVLVDDVGGRLCFVWADGKTPRVIGPISLDSPALSYARRGVLPSEDKNKTGLLMRFVTNLSTSDRFYAGVAFFKRNLGLPVLEIDSAGVVSRELRLFLPVDFVVRELASDGKMLFAVAKDGSLAIFGV